MAIKKAFKGRPVIWLYLLLFYQGCGARKYFPGQERVKSAFELALRTELEGYNLYVSGPEFE